MRYFDSNEKSYTKNYISLRHVRRWKRGRIEAVIIAVVFTFLALITWSWYWLIPLLLLEFLICPEVSPNSKTFPFKEMWVSIDDVICPYCGSIFSDREKHKYLKLLPWKAGSFECSRCHRTIQVRDDRPQYTILAPMRMILLLLMIADACGSLYLLYYYRDSDVELILIGFVLIEILLFIPFVKRYQRITINSYHICVRHFGYIWCELRWSDVLAIHRKTLKDGKEYLILTDAYKYKVGHNNYLHKGDAICIRATARNVQIIKRFYIKDFMTDRVRQ